MRSAGSSRTRGRRARAPLPRCRAPRPRAGRSIAIDAEAARARRIICAPPSTSSTALAPEAGEEERAGRPPAVPDAGREGRGRADRGAGDRQRATARRCRRWSASLRRLERKAAELPGLFDAAGRRARRARSTALDEARRRPRGRSSARWSSIRASWKRPRSGCSRCAPPAASTRSRSTISPRSPRDFGRASRRWRPASARARARWSAEAAAAREAYRTAATALSRSAAARGRGRSETAVKAELPELKLEAAQFIVDREVDPEAASPRPASTGSPSRSRPIPAPSPGR